MSAFRNLATRRAPLVSYGIAQRAGFHSSIARSAGKESKLHEEGRAQEAEDLKQKNLKEQKEGKGRWEEGLASDSESAIKADRNEVEASEETIKKLQKEAEKVAGKRM